MPEELSAESKLYVKEEIENAKKEIREDVEKAKSEATRTLTTVAIVVGLLTGLGVYGLAVKCINKALDDKVLADLTQQAQESCDVIAERRTEAENIVSKLRLFDQQEASPNGYAWVGSILFQWGTVSNADPNTTYEFARPFPNECFSVVSNVKRTAGRTAAIHIWRWSNGKFYINRDNAIDGWMDVNYIAVGR